MISIQSLNGDENDDCSETASHIHSISESSESSVQTFYLTLTAQFRDIAC